jgi:hypothetical protein
MFIGLFGSDIRVKLSPTDQQRVRAVGGGDYGPAERPMGGYVSLPASAEPQQMSGWVASALAFVSNHPPSSPRLARLGTAEGAAAVLAQPATG